VTETGHVRVIPAAAAREAQVAALSDYTVRLAAMRAQHVDRRDARRWWPLAFTSPIQRHDGDPFAAIATIRSWTADAITSGQ
jgi:hypothetical protein